MNTFTESGRLPLNPQLPTYHCVALSDVHGQKGAQNTDVNNARSRITSGLETGTADPEYFFDLSEHFAESAG